MSNHAKFAAAGIAAVIGLSFIGSCFTIVDTGERAVVLRLGEYKYTMSEGVNFKLPVVDRTVKFNVRDNNYSSKHEVSSSDIQTIVVETSLIYSLDPNKVGDIYKSYADKYEDVVIKPALAEIVQSTISEYRIDEFVEKRSAISQKIADRFKAKTEHTGIILKAFNITNHDFSDQFNKAIEDKKIAEQGALKAKYDLERVKLEAEAQRQKQASLSPMVLQEKAIDKWDGKLPQYMSGNGNLPFIIQQQ